MWNLSKQAKDQFLKINLLPIHESDEEWEIVLREAKEEGEDIRTRLKGELDEVKRELLEIIPSRFHRYVEDGSLNQPTLPTEVREDYLNWIRDGEKDFEKVLDAAAAETEKAASSLPASVQEVLSEGLHDTQIDRISRTKDTLHLFINTDGGFTTKAYIHFTFKEILSEESDAPLQVGQWFVYHELQKFDSGYALRVLFDCPDAEWTIAMKDLEAVYYYRPASYLTLNDEEKLEETTFTDYIAQLPHDYNYWLITPDVTCKVKAFSEKIELENGTLALSDKEAVVSFGNMRFTYSLEEYNPITFIYTDVFETPYSEQEEPLPLGEVEEAALSDDLMLQVRAWNTMYADPHTMADIINRVLWKVVVTEENEMMIHVYANHFYEAGVLTEDVIEKYRDLFE
ncbi:MULTISPECIES: DUF4085 family protein [Bacillaceae]|uniref:DUF4085 domain-containing protein n=1 Tax=Evansella alkalicola TaxID=745819 RepID=A0ABS6K0C8_9BACI|nr:MULTISPECIES: DUF4085 family protein [Bacillaceae]MBU9722805.1 DUF4085 domain-containing protein [Bacillus alkalicola]